MKGDGMDFKVTLVEGDGTHHTSGVVHIDTTDGRTPAVFPDDLFHAALKLLDAYTPPDVIKMVYVHFYDDDWTMILDRDLI